MAAPASMTVGRPFGTDIRRPVGQGDTAGTAGDSTNPHEEQHS